MFHVKQVVSIVFLVSISAFCAQNTHVYGVRPDSSPVTSLTNSSVEAKVLVLYFVASDCPVSNRTFPEMKRVREEYQSRGVAFWFVYPNSGEQGADVRSHQKAFDPGGEAILDSSGTLARMAHARVTPEVAVLTSTASQSWVPVYTGRIDDRYVHLGLERPAATQHFAERVIAEVLRGEHIEAATGTPVGCGISSPPQ
jgi:hypothetical protein